MRVRYETVNAVLRGTLAVALEPTRQRAETMRARGSRYARAVLDGCQGNKREACRVLEATGDPGCAGLFQ